MEGEASRQGYELLEGHLGVWSPCCFTAARCCLSLPSLMLTALCLQGGHRPQLRQYVGCAAGMAGGCKEFVPLRGVAAGRRAQVSSRFCPDTPPPRVNCPVPLFTHLA